MTGPRDLAAMLSHLGHLGTEGRRPRVLPGVVTAVGATRVSVSIMGATPVPDLEVAAGFGGGRMPRFDERVWVEAVQYSHVVVDTYASG